jgi:23S rRNA pseudouridine1911/1915/1917 synthase
VDKPIILAETAGEVVIVKPPGMPAQGDETGDLDALTWAAREVGRPLHLVHRLDRPVGGLMVFAKTPQKAAEWTRRFQKGAVRKRYVAVTEPTLYPAFGELRHYLQKDSKRHRAKLLYRPTPGAQVAVLRYQVLAEKNNRSLAQIELETGRFHQIRAQLSEVGSPIVGDVKYGYPPPAPDPQAIALWAYQLDQWHYLPPTTHPYWQGWPLEKLPQ